MELDDAARARIARGWASSCLTQPEYAARFGISDRALRAWMAKYGVGERTTARARTIIENAIEDLRALLAGLDAEAERQVGTGEAADPEAPVRRATSERTSVRAEPVTAPRPMPRGFFSGF